jgi:AcrR family transcriptional regulator
MFAESGYDGTSLRSIATQAGFDLSLVLYHFRSKEGLYQAVFERGIEAILRQRHDHVAKMIRSPQGVSVEELLYAFSKPWLELFARDEDNTAIVFARSLFDHSDRQQALVEEHVDPEARFFIDALQAAAPNAPAEEVHRCYHLFIGQLVYSILERSRIARLSGKRVADVKRSLDFTARIIADRLKGAG